jgi:shikimate kinase
LDTSLREQNIVLIGFMGVGKTTVGKLVAKKLFRDFLDIDEEIEKEYKMPVSQIFAELGEKVFREREKEFIMNLCQHKIKIISVGGGAFLQEEIKNVCMSTCTVIYLDISWQDWKSRLELISESRPVLQGKSLTDIEDLFYKRKEIYTSYHSKIEVGNQSAEEVADSIVQSLKISWELHETK